MELHAKPEILTSYVYGPTFCNAESRLFLFAAQFFNIESMQKVFLCHSCVKTLPATKITLITSGIYFGSLEVKHLQVRRRLIHFERAEIGGAFY
jgi:hypothetical protein